jgi:hypothetical protein
MDSLNISELTKNAELDQMVAGLVTFARASRTYYLELIESGFKPAQAFELTKHWQSALFSQSSGNK